MHIFTTWCTGCTYVTKRLSGGAAALHAQSMAPPLLHNHASYGQHLYLLAVHVEQLILTHLHSTGHDVKLHPAAVTLLYQVDHADDSISAWSCLLQGEGNASVICLKFTGKAQLQCPVALSIYHQKCWWLGGCVGQCPIWCECCCCSYWNDLSYNVGLFFYIRYVDANVN